MRLVITSDTHVTVDSKTIPDGDVFIHCGDLCSTGYPDDWKLQLEWLAELKHPTKLIIFGNHDFHPYLYPGPAMIDLRKIGFYVLGYPGNDRHAVYTLPNNKTILGLPFVTNLPRWAFNIDRNELNDYLTKFRNIDIVCSHAPIYGVLDKVCSGEHVGIKSYKNFLEAVRPELWFHGHIHEGYGKFEYEHKKFNKVTNIYNVAMCGQGYKHENLPIVIDI